MSRTGSNCVRLLSLYLRTGSNCGWQKYSAAMRMSGVDVGSEAEGYLCHTNVPFPKGLVSLLPSLRSLRALLACGMALRSFGRFKACRTQQYEIWAGTLRILARYTVCKKTGTTIVA